jgi:hypothetical protein
MKPYAQGDLTGLCGVYSVINATRIVAGLNKEESEKLFRRIMRYIADARLVADGIGIRMIGRLLRDVVGERIEHRAMPFRNHRDATLDEIWGTLDDFFAEDDHRAAIIYVEGPKGHWTTVRDATHKQLLLTDSVGYHVLSKGKCTVGARNKEHPHALYPPCIYLLS